MGLARSLRRLADRLDTPGARDAARLGVPLSLHRCLRRVAREHDVRTVLDVGAHKGEFARAAAACLPGAALHAFEPLAGRGGDLTALRAMLPGLRVHEVAIGEYDGEIQMLASEFAPSSSALGVASAGQALWPAAARGEMVRVPARTIDSLAAEHGFEAPILLKMDIQGYELRALRGARETLRRVCAVLTETLFEPIYEGQADFASVTALLAAHGLEFAGLIDEWRDPASDTLVYADALFLRRA